MALELGLTGKVALITGGSEGLGRAMAQRLSAEGVRVAICARREVVLRRAAAEIQAATGTPVLAVPLDITAPEAAARFVEAAVERFGRLDILINNAGTSAGGRFDAQDDAYWEGDFALKVFAAARCIRLAVPHMRRQGGGRILNIVNTAAKAPRPESLPTAASRAAGLALTKALAHEYARDRILVNAICIGIVKSMQWERQRLAQSPPPPPEEFYAQMAARAGIPLGRVGEAEELADLAAFLVSERAAYITGVAINFDGGRCPVV